MVILFALYPLQIWPIFIFLFIGDWSNECSAYDLSFLAPVYESKSRLVNWCNSCSGAFGFSREPFVCLIDGAYQTQRPLIKWGQPWRGTVHFFAVIFVSLIGRDLLSGSTGSSLKVAFATVLDCLCMNSFTSLLMQLFLTVKPHGSQWQLA